MLSSPLPPPPLRRAGAVLLALAVASALPLAAAAPAAAHDRLASSDPGDGATLDVAPDAVTLTMSSTPLGLGTRVQVTGPAGVVSEGDAQVVDATVRQPLVADRPAGSYEVQWRVTSSDGHPVSGSFTFTASTATGGAAPSGTTAGAPTQEPTDAPAPDATTPAVDPVSQAGSGGGPAVAVGAAVVVVLAGIGAVTALRRRRG